MTDEEIQAEVKKYEFDTRCCCVEAGMCFAHAEMFRLVKRLIERVRSEAVEEAAKLELKIDARYSEHWQNGFLQGVEEYREAVRRLAPRSQDERKG
jgi:hypothetical protein